MVLLLPFLQTRKQAWMLNISSKDTANKLALGLNPSSVVLEPGLSTHSALEKLLAFGFQFHFLSVHLFSGHFKVAILGLWIQNSC